MTEKNLKRHTFQFQSLAENTQDLIYRIQLVPERKFEYVSPSATRITGYTPEEHYRDPDLGFKLVHPADRHILEALAAGDMHPYRQNPVVLRWIRKDGTIIWTEQQNVPVYNEEGTVVAIEGIARDITERKNLEEEIIHSLEEKEVLLQEIHHRVKNNLQVVSSLLNLQSLSIKNKELTNIFRESQNRIQSMALIHEVLYQSDNLRVVDFTLYIKRLTAYLVQSYHIPDITFSILVENVLLGLDTAIPCGLIITELVSNSLRHAFPDGNGEITIALCACEGNIELLVADNGVGMPDNTGESSLGLQLVTMLVKDQLNGDITVDRCGGTKIHITFFVK